jgi:hypothetical protein
MATSVTQLYEGRFKVIRWHAWREVTSWVTTDDHEQSKPAFMPLNFVGCVWPTTMWVMFTKLDCFQMWKNIQHELDFRHFRRLRREWALHLPCFCNRCLTTWKTLTRPQDTNKDCVSWSLYRAFYNQVIDIHQMLISSFFIGLISAPTCFGFQVPYSGGYSFLIYKLFQVDNPLKMAPGSRNM